MSLNDKTHTLLGNYKFILGSTSPRRLEILQRNLGISAVHVLPSDYPEDLSKEGRSSEEYVMETCRNKGNSILSKINLNERTLILTSDTIITCGGEIFEKPKSKDKQLQMFLKYKKNHIVKAITAVNLIKISDRKVEEFHDLATTVLHFNQSEEIINSYIQTEEGLNVAGGFKFQEKGCLLFSEIHGDYFNVVGLPVHKTWTLIEESML